ncbi:MAG: carbohydrate porin [Janthinobacterium lividum]
MIVRGFSTVRPQDAISLLFIYDKVSGILGHVQAAERRLGVPLGNGATGVQTHEELMEVNYDIHLYAGLGFAPDVQYVHQPNAQSSIRDAVVFGFKSHIEF